MLTVRASLCAITFATGCLGAQVANAVVSTVPSAGVAALSLKATIATVPSGVGLATYGLSKDSDKGFWGGLGIAAGGIILGLVDPPAATFYSGAFSFHYDGSLMRVRDTGWLGSWGEVPALPAPPVDSSLWDGVTAVLQQPGAGLTAAIVDDTTGLQTISFDWGPSGHAADSAAPFNFFATAFEFTTPVRMTYLGDFAQAPAGSNFYVSNTAFNCTLPPPDDLVMRQCGEPMTSYYEIHQIPEPGTVVLLGLGIGLLAIHRRTQRPRTGATAS